MKTQYDQSLCPILVPDCPVQTLDDVRWRVVDPFVVDLLPVKLSQNITEHQMECLADTFGLAKQQDFGCFPRVHLPQEVDCIK